MMSVRARRANRCSLTLKIGTVILDLRGILESCGAVILEPCGAVISDPYGAAVCAERHWKTLNSAVRKGGTCSGS